MSRSLPRWLQGVLLALLAIASIAAGCSSSDETDQLVGTEYWSTRVEVDGVEHQLVDDTRIILRFRDGELGASAGCNNIGGGYRVEDGRLRATDLFTTEMGCDPARHDQDQLVIDLLTGDPEVTLDGDDLRLATDTVTVDFVSAAIANPDRSLTGTNWQLDGFLSADTASSFATDSAATMTIAGDGTMSLFDGCVDVDIGATIEDDELTFTAPAMPSDPTCTAPDGYREHIYGALGTGSLQYSITGTNLTLTDANGTGLTFRALT